jgi:L-aspartate oxidase
VTDLAPQPLWGRPVIIGAGIAGAVAALTLAPLPVVLLDRAPDGKGAASRWAQGGLAAAVGSDDSPALQVADTIAAGAGLTDRDAAARIIAAGPAAVAALEGFGVRFDRGADGAFALGLEAAHARRRILHVRDSTGHAILAALHARIAATPSITRLTGTARRLIVADGAIAGLAFGDADRTAFLPTNRVVLATGGIGGLWNSTTNPASARGLGLALAARAGAVLQDLEFVQFHPTALAVGTDPLPLMSEAIRGEGALLIDAEGERFMAGIEGGELAPRDVVAREVFRQWARGGRAALDMRHWPAGKFAGRFPNIHRVLASYGLDPARDPIPVRPAAHYHMGGVKVGETGRTSVDGLWACGEVAATGLHGANRLASNSLLEAVVCGRLVAQDIAGVDCGPARIIQTGAIPVLPVCEDFVAAIREAMEYDVGVVRSAAGLDGAIQLLDALRQTAMGTEDEDIAGAALMIAQAALRRRESRGAHFRSDATPPIEPPCHSISRWDDLG